MRECSASGRAISPDWCACRSTAHTVTANGADPTGCSASQHACGAPGRLRRHGRSSRDPRQQAARSSAHSPVRNTRCSLAAEPFAMGGVMFLRKERLQYNAAPVKPDPIYAKQLQEVLGGQWGEISVMMSYLFQGWNCRGPAKYRDMLLDIGTEEIAHVEMLATMIARLLESSPVEAQED